MDRTESTNWDDVWAKYEKMIKKIAYNMHLRYPRFSFEELLAEGIWGAWSHLQPWHSQQWDPSRSKLSTWIYRTAYHRMKNMCMKRQVEFPCSSCSEEEVDRMAEAEQPFSFIEELKKDLSQEASHLVRIILEAPEELAEVVAPRRPKKSEAAVKAYLIDVLDWTRHEVERAWEEVRVCLQ